MGYSRPRRIEERLVAELLLALVLLLLVVIQSSVLLRPFGIPINLVLLVVISRALTTTPSWAARWALYGGLGLDVCSSGVPLGTHTLALLAATPAASLPLTGLSRENWLLPLGGALFGSLAYYGVLGLMLALLVAPVDARQYAVVAALPGTLAVLIPALPLFLLLRVMQRRRRGEVPIDIY